ncbi:MAG TPA: DNA primase [Leucothrix mucor]|nr:DNA primase [Leucothrix mucor]
MAGRIPQEFIDGLLARVDVVDIINARVPLKKKGREYTACCPFHNEKTPSFTVSTSKQFYHCFGCGEHGNAISFLMEYDHMDYVEAIETLASQLGLDVPREGGNQAPKKRISKDLYDLMQDASDYFQLQLKGSSAASQYLENRGLSAEISTRFMLGYSLASWDSALKHLTVSYTSQQIIETGLVIEKDTGGEYDRYRDRIMFPIRNRKGQVIGFGGRVMGDEKPKYINSPETELFHKGSELYGFYEARDATRKLERIIVVEGYMDVIALAQYGISYAVATLGTSTTQEHIQQLFRSVPEVIFCFDGDRAGKEAAWRALDNALSMVVDGKEIRFLFLAEGEDPDTLVRKIGKDAFEDSYTSDALALTDYLLSHLQEQFNISSREGKSRFLKALGELVKKMPDSLIRDQLITEVSVLTSIEVIDIKKTLLGRRSKTPFKVTRVKDREVRHTPIRYAITLLLHDTSLVKFVENPEQIALSNLSGADLLTTLIETIEENPHINGASLLERWRNTDFEASLIRLMKWQPDTDDNAVLVREFQDCLRQIRKKANEKKLEALIHKERTDGLTEREKQDFLILLQES